MKNKFFLVVFLAIMSLGNQTINSQNSTNSSKEINELIAKKRTYNKKFGYGYRIQIYYGNETEAKSTLSKFRIEFPGIYNTILYNEPDWKVQVGSYKTKLEADKALLIFKEKFSGIILIPMGK
jgi:hypothetical protein